MRGNEQQWRRLCRLLQTYCTFSRPMLKSWQVEQWGTMHLLIRSYCSNAPLKCRKIAMYLLVWYTFLPSEEATRHLKVRPPCSFRCARPAIGVLQEPSRVPRNALSHWMAILVSSWFKEASSSRVFESFSRQAMPIAPCRHNIKLLACTTVLSAMLIQGHSCCRNNADWNQQLHSGCNGMSEQRRFNAETGSALGTNTVICTGK